MFKKMLLKQMMKAQMKDVPIEQQEQMLNMIEKNPELFQKIALETKALMDGGMDQMSAAMKVAEKYREELRGNRE